MNTAIVTTTAANVTPFIQNLKQPQQKQTAKEAIAANVQALIEQLEQPRDILKWMSDPDQMARMVKGTPLAALIDPTAPAQRAGVISSLNMVADSLELPKRVFLYPCNCFLLTY
jgi:hypothetical protein